MSAVFRPSLGNTAGRGRLSPTSPSGSFCWRIRSDSLRPGALVGVLHRLAAVQDDLLEQPAGLGADVGAARRLTTAGSSDFPSVLPACTSF
jgi:hypothetical protein